MKRFFLMMVVVAFVTSAMAVPAHKGKVTVKQPDGTSVTLRLHGDEYMHFTTTADGYSVVKNVDGYYVYAAKEDGQLAATEQVAHDPMERSTSEVAFLASIDKYLAPEMTAQAAAEKKAELKRQAQARAEHRAAQYDYNNFRGLLILVQFNDKEFSRSDYAELLEGMVNTENYTGYENQTYTGSVRDYFYDNSAGQFAPEFDVVGPVTVNYSQYDPNGTSNAWQILSAALTAADSQVDFSNYDGDGDGYVDLVYFIVAGNGANFGGNDSRLFWPHRSSFGGYIRKDGVRVGDYASSVELYGYTSYPSTVKIDGIGTICHEFSHVLGLPDFYDTDYDESGGESNHPDSWSVMAGGSYFNDSRTPCGYSLFERYAVGFAQPQTINAEGSYTLEDIDESNTGFRINTSVDKEYFMLENRQRNKWNTYLPGHGMLVFRVDSTDNSVWYYNNVNVNPSHNYYEMVRAGGWKGQASSYDPFPGSGRVKTLNNVTSPANLVPWNDGGAKWALKNITEQTSGAKDITFDIEDAYVLKSISMEETLNVGVGVSRTLTVTGDPNYVEYTLTWTSSNPQVATVDQEGHVTGVKVGSCTITAKTEKGLTATCAVTVEEKLVVDNIAEFKDLEEGTEAIVNLTNAMVLYTYDNKAYVKDATGGLILDNIGLTADRWSVLNGPLVGKYTIDKRMPTLVAVEGETSVVDLTITAGTEIDPREITMEELTEDDYVDYIVVRHAKLMTNGGVFAVGGENSARLWNPFKIKNIKVPTDYEGKYYDVTCLYGTDILNNDTINELYLLESLVEVEYHPALEALTLTESGQVVVGSTLQLEATATPDDAEYTLTWTSDDENVATVSAEGVVTGVACGTCTITATADNGMTATCKVLVTAAEKVDDIATAVQLNDGDIVPMNLNGAAVLYVHNNKIYVRDATGSIVLANTGITPARWQVVNGLVNMQLTYENNMPALVPVEGWSEATDFLIGEGSELQPREVAVDDFKATDYADYVILKAVAIDVDGDYYAVGEAKNVRLFNTFGIADVTLPEDYELHLYDVEGIFGTNVLDSNIIDEVYLLKAPVAVQDIPSGIATVNVDDNDDAPSYNLAGQKVNAQYKGIIIRKGKKIVKK